MLIHLRLHLEIAEVVDDSNLLSSLDALSQFHIEQADFARNGAADVQFSLRWRTSCTFFCMASRLSPI